MLDAHSDLPSTINRLIDWLLAFDTTSTKAEQEEKHNELKMQLCEMVAKHNWYYTACLLKDGIGHGLASKYWRAVGYPLLEAGVEDLADKLAVATYFNNHDAILMTVACGANPWVPSYSFGCPLSIAALYGQLHGTVDSILGLLPERVAMKRIERESIIRMFRIVIETLVSQKEYDAAAYLVDWVSNHVVAVPREGYNKCKSAFKLL